MSHPSVKEKLFRNIFVVEFIEKTSRFFLLIGLYPIVGCLVFENSFKEYELD
jgi:hypothetical protein